MLISQPSAVSSSVLRVNIDALQLAVLIDISRLKRHVEVHVPFSSVVLAVEARRTPHGLLLELQNVTIWYRHQMGFASLDYNST